jgi:DNA-binding HxlR family transcriptional regulator
MRTKESVERCPVFIASHILGKRWTILILQVLMTVSEGMRFSEIQRELSWVSPKILTQRLRELEGHSLLRRDVDSRVIPPHVTYTLTQKGADLRPALVAMQSWGIKHGGNVVAACPGQGFDECANCSDM